MAMKTDAYRKQSAAAWRDSRKIVAAVVPDTFGGKSPEGLKVSVIHWVDAASSVPAEVRLYSHLMKTAKPAARIRAGDQPRTRSRRRSRARLRAVQTDQGGSA